MKNTTITSAINFYDIFDLDEIQHLQDLFSDATGVASLITAPDGTPITKPSNFCRLYNEIIRNTKIGLSNCFKSDAFIGSLNPTGPIVQPCLSGGLWDAGVSINVSGLHIANWLVGQVRDTQIDEIKMLQYADEIGVERKIFMEALYEVPVMSQERFKKVANMLLAFANQLSEKAYNNLQLQSRNKELEEATSALRDSNELLSLFMKHSPIFAFIKEVTPTESRVLLASENFTEMIGVPGSEMQGKNMYELFPAEFAAKITTDDWEVVANGTSLTIEEELNGREYLTLKFPIDKDGKKFLAGYTIDINERKQAETALLQSREMYRDLIELAVDGVLVGSSEGYIIDANSYMCSIAGRNRDELLGKHINHSIFKPESLSRRPMQFDKLKNGETVVSERIVLRPDGTEIEIEMRTKMMPNGTYQSIFRDITKRKKAEAQLQQKNNELYKLNLEKDKFFSIIAHDLRSPFNIFLGNTYLLVHAIPNLKLGEIQEMAVSIRDSAINLHDLLDNLLEWSRMQSAGIKCNPSPYQMYQEFSRCLNPILETAKNKEIKIELSVPADLIVHADFTMTGSIFRNLVSNSLKFTKRGGQIQIEAKPSNNNHVEISIKDNGIGMTETMLGKLFRIDGQTNRKGTEGEPSTGLGLIICKEFTEVQGGKLWVESEEGKGTAFYFTLPLYVENEIMV
ncbi:MAG: PocR ligand-binding domain-containing protein [Bacteroidales bacterium]